jgi:hypothetical protein
METPIYELGWQIRHPEPPFTVLKSLMRSSGDLEWVIGQALTRVTQAHSNDRS